MRECFYLPVASIVYFELKMHIHKKNSKEVMNSIEMLKKQESFCKMNSSQHMYLLTYTKRCALFVFNVSNCIMSLNMIIF